MSLAPEAKVENIYTASISTRVEIDRKHTVSYYTRLASRSLRLKNELIIEGKGHNITIAVSVVATLEKQNIAFITSMKTGLDISSIIEQSYTNPSRTQPTAMMLFKLEKGPFGDYISGYQKDKIIEIFEKYDAKIEGYLTLDTIKSFKFEEIFFANKEQIKNANEFLTTFKQEQKLDLPNFIKYSSILTHPLLKDSVFSNVLSNDFNM